MNKSAVSIILLSLMVMLNSCSRKVIRQPVSEIDRPLFLPAKNWQGSIGAGVERKFEEHRQKNYDLDNARFSFVINNKTTFFPILGLQWPSIHIGEKVEIYAPATLRWYFIKNTEKTEGIERINGFNSAIVNGITNISYTGYYGFRIYTRHTFPIKLKLSKRSWLASNAGLYFVLPIRRPLRASYEALLRVPVSLGYQITERWSCKGTFILLEFYNYYSSKWTEKDHSGGSYNENWEYKKRTFDLDLKIPLQTSYVFNHNCEVSFLVESNIYDKNNYGVASALWWTFTW